MRNLSLPLLLTVLIFSSCTATQKPISKEPAQNNADYKVEYLFEHEGCKVYRFLDAGCYVYFTNCNGEAISRKDSVTTIRNMTHAQN